MAYGPQWKSLQVANPNVSGLMSMMQDGFTNAGQAGQNILASYDEGQKLKNDAVVAQELAGIDTPEQMSSWLKKGGLNGRNVSEASLGAIMDHRKNVHAAARALAKDTSSTNKKESSKISTDALLALALNGTVVNTPAVTTGDPLVRPTGEAVVETPSVTVPAPFVPGATSTEVKIPDVTSLSDDDLAAEIKALEGN